MSSSARPPQQPLSSPSPSPAPSPPLILALSGPTSSGKTTLAHHLHRIFSSPQIPTSILHCDDFYLPESQLPKTPSGTLDWDSAASLDLPTLLTVLTRLKTGQENVKDVMRQVTGRESLEPSPPNNEEQEGRQSGGISKSVINSLETSVQASSSSTSSSPQKNNNPPTKRRPLIIIEGFLLLSPTSIPSPMRETFTLKILLPTPYHIAKRRREARSGYSTQEGWWEDPPGYFDEVVWPNYVAEHAGFFEGGDVNGKVDEEMVKREGIEVPDGMMGMGEKEGDGQGNLEGTLRWLVRRIMDEL